MKQLSQKTILLVEDEAPTAKAYKKDLEEFGYNVLTATSGETVISNFDIGKIDLILMDIDPGTGMHAIETAETILKDNEIPIVFLSGNNEAEILKKTEKITSYGYVVKNTGKPILHASIKLAFKLFEATIKHNENEEALRKSEMLLNTTQQLTKVGGWDLDVQSNISFWTNETYNIHGLKEDSTITDASKIVARSLECYDLNDRPIIQEAFRQCVEHGKSYDLEFPFTSFRGDRKWIRTTAKAVRENNKIVKLIGNIMDITEQHKKSAEAARLKTAIEQVPVGVALADADINLYFCNAAGLGMRGEDLKKLVTIPKDAFKNWQVLKPDGKPYEIEELPLVRAVTKGLTINEDLIVRHPDGSEHLYDATAVPVYDENEKIVGGVIIFPDITERRQAEKELEKALQQNKNLLRELQHRAKNSFTMISSLIHLSTDASESDEVKTALSEVGSRILAVSEMYNLLYLTDSVTEINLGEYLDRITVSLRNISGNITIENTFDAVTLPVKAASPVGIIAAELITNSIKHAFPGNRSGTISLLLKKKMAGAVLEVRDNGIGLPGGLDVSEVDSLGLKIVHILVEQIDGSIKVHGGDGTRWILEFPIIENDSD